MQPLLNGYSEHIQGNILEILFRPYLEKLGFFKKNTESPEQQEGHQEMDELKPPVAPISK